MIRQRKKKTPPPPTWLHSEIHDNKDGHGRTLGGMSLGCGLGPGQGPFMYLLYVGWQGTVHFSTQLFVFIIFISPCHQYRYRSPSRSEGGAFVQYSPAPQKQPVISALLNAECRDTIGVQNSAKTLTVAVEKPPA